MVNTGQPSTACFQCRARRIKCDSIRPQCERCVKYGVVCPGYPEKNLLTFRDDTDRVRERAFKKYERSRRVQEGLSPHPVLTTEETSSDSSDNSSFSNAAEHALLQSRRAGEPAEAFRPSLVQGAIAVFLTQWSMPGLDVFWGALDCAADFYRSPSPSGCFGAALQAISVLAMSLPRDNHTLDIRRAAMKSYGVALTAINEALDDPIQRLHDHTLIAVLFICLFEMLAELANRADRVMIHLLGLMAMVRMRGPHQFRLSSGRRLFLSACFFWNIASIPMPRPMCPPLPDDICEVLLNNKLGKHQDSYRLLPIAHRAVNVRGSALELLRSDHQPPNRGALLALLSEVESLDQGLLAWYNSLPKHWAKPEQIYELFTLNICRAHRLFLQDLRIRCYRQLAIMERRGYEEEIKKCVYSTRSLVDEMCSVVPYNFADDDPHARTGDELEAAIIPKVKVNIFYHMTFSFPLLVSSMVDALPQKQKEGIDVARKACADSCGVQRPFRTLPKVLVRLRPFPPAPPQAYNFGSKDKDEKLELWVAHTAKLSATKW